MDNKIEEYIQEFMPERYNDSDDTFNFDAKTENKYNDKQNLNGVLKNSMNLTSLGDIKDIISLKDIQEFLEKIGIEWDYFINDCDLNFYEIDDIESLITALAEENHENEIFKHDVVLSGEYFFTISSIMFHHCNNNWKKVDKDYSVDWINFLASKYGEKYVNIIAPILKKAIDVSDLIPTPQKDIGQMKEVYNNITGIKYY